MKVCVLVIFLALPWISRVGDWALRWTEGNEDLQVFFVMLFFPVIMNATQYYIIDSFIKKQKSADQEPLSVSVGEGVDSAVDPRPFLDPVLGNEEIHSDDDDGVPVEEAKEAPVGGRNKKIYSGRGDEHHYNPQVDGESSPTVVGSSSSSERGQLLDDPNSKEEPKPIR
jgi:STIMATE family